MLNTIEKYWLWISTLIIAALSIWVAKSGNKIADLQKDLILNKLDTQLNNAISKSTVDLEEYKNEMDKYNRLNNHYKSLYPSG